MTIPLYFAFSAHTSRKSGFTWHELWIAFDRDMQATEARRIGLDQQRTITAMLKNISTPFGHYRRVDETDAVIQALFGMSPRDLITHHMRRCRCVVLGSKYALPEDRIPRFESGRRRDKTWCSAIRLRHNPELRDLLLSYAEFSDDYIRRLTMPDPVPFTVRQYCCAMCGRAGARSAFRERYLPGLATSVGIDCPQCPDCPSQSPTHELLAGRPRGEVKAVAPSVMFCEEG